MAPEQAQLNGAPAWSNFHHAFMDRLRALPGVEAVGIVENFPLEEGFAVVPFTREATAAGAAAAEHQLGLTFVAGDYFEAMGVALLRGRIFTEAEQRENPGYIVVSRPTSARSFARSLPTPRCTARTRSRSLSRALDSLLYGVRSLDAVTLVATSLLMLLVGAARAGSQHTARAASIPRGCSPKAERTSGCCGLPESAQTFSVAEPLGGAAR